LLGLGKGREKAMTSGWIRDEMGQDILLFIDNIFRFVQAGSEVSALLGRMPSAVGYQPNLATELGELEERITSTTRGSITSVQAIYVPADDFTDPAPATTFSHLDATTNLSRALTEMLILESLIQGLLVKSITKWPKRLKRFCSGIKIFRI